MSLFAQDSYLQHTSHVSGHSYPTSSAYSSSAHVQQSPLKAMNTVLQSSSHLASTSHSSQVWFADSGASDHMTVDLANLFLVSPYPSNNLIHSANGEDLTVSHIGHSVIHTNASSLKLNYVLCVPCLA